MPKLTSTGLRWLWVSLLVIVLDQISKAVIVRQFFLGEREPVMPMLNLTLVHNHGSAFGMLANQPGWQKWFFVIIALVISAVLLVWLYRTSKGSRLLSLSLALIIGGAVGNVIDRLAYGYVIDFIDFYVGNYHWPSFNVADSAICIGVVLLILHTLVGGHNSGHK